MYEGRILVINGPNLNMLGIRDPEKYGNITLEAINTELQKIAQKHKYHAVFFQSNCEGEIVSRIQRAYTDGDGTSGILINAAAYTHTSIAILDALTLKGEGKAFPYVEVHLSDPKLREHFRRHSYLEASAILTVSGHEDGSYYNGLTYLILYLKGLKSKQPKT